MGPSSPQDSAPSPSTPPIVGVDEERDCPVVGIGASAGGVGALRRFFRNLPGETGVAFVVVLHLSPDHEINLTDIL